MSIPLSSIVQDLRGQPMFRLIDRVEELGETDKDFIPLHIGDLYYSIPKIAEDSAISAIFSGKNHYLSSYGLTEFRDAIRNFVYKQKQYGYLPDLEEVIVTPGCNFSIYALCQCLLEKGDNVLTIEPTFPTYTSVFSFCHINNNKVITDPNSNFDVTIDQIKSAVDSKTKIILINSPCNPTGKVLSREFINDLVKFCIERKIFIISDDVYQLVSYCESVPHSSFVEGAREVLISINSFSKSFSMSGWRIGYMIAPKDLIDAVSLFIQTTLSCTPSVFQYACKDMLNHGIPESFYDMMEDLREKKKSVIEFCKRMNFPLNSLDGAFYAFPDISSTGMDCDSFTERMIKHGVLVIPGNEFGESYTKHIRISYSVSAQDLIVGLNRIENAVNGT